MAFSGSFSIHAAQFLSSPRPVKTQKFLLSGSKHIINTVERENKEKHNGCYLDIKRTAGSAALCCCSFGNNLPSPESEQECQTEGEKLLPRCQRSKAQRYRHIKKTFHHNHKWQWHLSPEQLIRDQGGMHFRSHNDRSFSINFLVLLHSSTELFSYHRQWCPIQVGLNRAEKLQYGFFVDSKGNANTTTKYRLLRLVSKGPFHDLSYRNFSDFV